MNTNVIPSAHNSKQTLQLFPDNRFEQPIIHVLIVNGDGKVVAQHDTPRAELVTAIERFTEEPPADDPTGATPPESTIEDLKRASDTTVINNVVLSAPTLDALKDVGRAGVRLVNIERATAWATFQKQQGISADPTIHQYEYRAWCAAWDAAKGNPWPARTNTTVEAL